MRNKCKIIFCNKHLQETEKIHTEEIMIVAKDTMTDMISTKTEKMINIRVTERMRGTTTEENLTITGVKEEMPNRVKVIVQLEAEEETIEVEEKVRMWTKVDKVILVEIRMVALAVVVQKPKVTRKTEEVPKTGEKKRRKRVPWKRKRQ